MQSKEGEIPETVVFDIPWFATQEPELATFRVPVRMAVDVDLVNESFHSVTSATIWSVERPRPSCSLKAT